jgi:hypothetical protein
MNSDQQMVAMLGLILILFVIFTTYKGTLSAIFFNSNNGSPELFESGGKVTSSGSGSTTSFNTTVSTPSTLNVTSGTSLD